MAPFDRRYTISYWSAIVSIVLPYTIWPNCIDCHLILLFEDEFSPRDAAGMLSKDVSLYVRLSRAGILSKRLDTYRDGHRGVTHVLLNALHWE